ncbi:MAG: Hpt domain-containing protein [Oligoflexus sp.]
MRQGHEPIHSKYHTDPLYQPLILDFLDDLPKLGDQIKEMVDRADWSIAQQLCHQLKGTAATYGYDELASIVGQLETHSQNFHETKPSEADEARFLVTEIDQLIARMLAAKNQM